MSFAKTLGLSLLFAIFVCPLPSMASHPAELFEVLWTVPGREVARHSLPDRARAVRLRPGALAHGHFKIGLWEDQSISVVRSSRTVHPGGSFTWLGFVEGYPGSQVSLTQHRGRIAGSIYFDERQFEISAGPRGSFFFEVDSGDLPRMPAPVAPGDGADESEGGSVPPSSAASITQDLLVVYSPASRARYGQAGIEAKILDAVVSANAAYQNSQIDLQLQLVHMAEIAYAESGDMGLALERLQGTSDGYMDSVHSLRDQVGADLVAMIDEDANYCGIAYVMQNESSGFASWAFSVTYSGCLANDTLAHEIGHNQGDAHDRASSSVAGTFSYSYGHRRCAQDGTGFRTVMSYSCSGASRIPYFSNPTIFFNGFATGVDEAVDPANSADNARSMNLTSDTTAAFRASVTATPPNVPTNLLAAANSFDKIDVSWNDASNDESGFHLERSADGSNWAQIASLPTNTTTHQDDGLDPSTSYHYRVSAFNSAGSSAPSNVGSASTLPPPPAPSTPTGLVATALSGTEIRLEWNDVANEEAYDVEVSLDGVSFSLLVSLLADQVSYTHSGLTPLESRYYRVSARSIGGSSDPSASVMATTDSFTYVFAEGEFSDQSAVSGSFTDTLSADGVAETLTESTTGGRPSRRKSLLEHRYFFDLPAGGGATLTVEAWRSGGGPDDFAFEISGDGGASWQQLIGVNGTSPIRQSAMLPLGLSGPIELRVADTNGSQGETIEDSIHVDFLGIHVDFDGATSPPAQPSGMTAQAMSSNHVALEWNDGSGDEMGFDIERSTDGANWSMVDNVAADVISYEDMSASPNTDYIYRVRAFNLAGASGWSTSSVVTTPDGLALSATGYKVKGVQQVDLVWSGAATAQCEIWRDGSLVAIVPNSGNYSESLGKGGASYDYQLCETGSGACTVVVSVVF
jgi:hypothetical protein